MIGSRQKLLMGAAGVKPKEPMVLVFDTTLATGTTVTVPLAGTVNVVIDWGDGNSEAFTTSGNKTHTYAAEGEYTVEISGSLTAFGANVSRPNFTKCLSFGDLGLVSLSSAFRRSANFIEAPAYLPLGVQNLSSVFDQAASFNGDISGWDVSSATDVHLMFSGASSFNQDIGNWDLSSVVGTVSTEGTAFSGAFRMFNNASSFNNGGSDNIKNLKIPSLVQASQMFFNASSFNQPIDAWDVSSVRQADDMFRGASAMTFPLGSWQTNLSGQPDRFSLSANATFQSFQGTADFPLLADGTTRINT